MGPDSGLQISLKADLPIALVWFNSLEQQPSFPGLVAAGRRRLNWQRAAANLASNVAALTLAGISVRSFQRTRFGNLGFDVFEEN
jgi:hypothetical protein